MGKLRDKRRADAHKAIATPMRAPGLSQHTHGYAQCGKMSKAHITDDPSAPRPNKRDVINTGRTGSQRMGN